MDRRTFAAGAAALTLARPGSGAARRDAAATAAIAALEAQAGGQLGAWVLDSATGRQFGWRGDQRFAQCSTFKLSLAACVLQRIDRGLLRADDRLAFGAADLLPNSPVTGANVPAGGMSVVALAEAAQKTSDNLAANLLLHRIGGPAALTAFWRSLGDRTARLDRYETELNRVPPGDRRDTVTPRGIAGVMAQIAVGKVLTRASRATLFGWMEATETGVRRIRAGLPAEWRAGDKTGTAASTGVATMVNDIALCWPAGRTLPLVIAGFYRARQAADSARTEDEAVLAKLGALAARWAQSGPA